MQGSNVSKICTAVMNFFNETVNSIDRSVKFVKRQSKLNAQLFVEMLISSCLSGGSISLERMCALLKERGIPMSKQGLHQRFNAEAKALMKSLFSEAIAQFKTEKKKALGLLNTFTGVKITDSTTISLPENLQKAYKGLGGVSSKSSLKLQVTWDYLYGQIQKVDITEGYLCDQGYTHHLDTIQAGALYLQDLGYYKVTSFQKIHINKAYFVSRYFYRTAIFDRADEKIDLLASLEKAGYFLEKKAFLGKKEKLPVRLIAFRLSDKDLEKRMRKIRRSFSRKGKKPSAEVLKFARWSMYITNVSEQVFAAEEVHLVYTVRWQIELLFKLCKSEIGMDKVNGRRTNRVICEIYAKLICALQFLYLCFSFHDGAIAEISQQKSYKLLKLRSGAFFNALKSTYRFSNFIKKLKEDITAFALQDRHRKKRSTYQKLIDSTHPVERYEHS